MENMNVEQTITLMQSKKIDAIREGAAHAGESRFVEAVPVLTGLLQSGNLGIQEAADTALRKIGGPQTVLAVIPLLRSDDVPVRNLAMDILREVGSHHLTALVALLQDPDPDIRIFAADILGSAESDLVLEPLCRALLDDSEINVRYQAAVSLGELGNKDAARCLNEAVSDDQWVQFAVVEALTKIRDESSVNAMIRALDTSSELISSMIVEGLGQMGNIKAVGSLLKRLDSTGTALRHKMVKAIVMILGPKGIVLLPLQERERLNAYLLSAIGDDEVEVQDAAIQGLAVLGGNEGSEAILNLAAQLDPVKDQDRLEDITGALASIGYNQALVEALRFGIWKKAVVAVRAMRGIQDNRFCPLLREAFWITKDLDLQREIVCAMTGMEDEGAGSFFMDVLGRHDDGHIIKQSLRYIGEKTRTREATRLVLSYLHHPFDDVKEAALDACVMIRDEAIIARSRAMLEADDPMHRLMAVYILGQIDASRYLEELRTALDDDLPDIRKIALEAIGSLCPVSPEVVDLIASKLNDASREVRQTLVEVFGQCPCPEVERYFFEALADEEDWVRIRAVEALGERRPAGAVDHLVSLLADPNAMVVLKTIDALGKIGGPTAFEALLQMLTHDDFEIQSAAEEAVTRIRHEE
ncbi:MAG: HEAT repeat domain-containing protein [Desulfovibrionales bacterium]